jgi:hypothetical protein
MRNQMLRIGIPGSGAIPIIASAIRGYRFNKRISSDG